MRASVVNAETGAELDHLKVQKMLAVKTGFMASG